MKPAPSAIAETLTQAEMTREAVAAAFRLADPDHEPLPRPWRVPVDWDGAAWTEFDPMTGEIVASGCTDTQTTGDMPS